MDMILVKLFATALALSEVMTQPQAVKTQFDPVKDQDAVVQVLRDGCVHMRQAFDIESINIDDLTRFMSDPAHAGSITGSIDFMPLGAGLPSTAGVFNLFSPTSDPTMKYMVYELGFNASNGQPYYMAGEKKVKDAPVTDMWKATTTLYTQLHQGTDKSGPVVGAGVLSLSVADLLEMIPTMHATNTSSAAEAADAVARFGRFFLGELWDTYVEKAGV